MTERKDGGTPPGAHLLCRILTPDKKKPVFEVEIRHLEAQTASGTIEILPGHEPLLTLLTIGPLTVTRWERRGFGDGVEHFAIHGGFLETDGKTATILASAAENVKEIDLDRALAAQARAKERLALVAQKKAEGIDPDRARLALLRATLRIQLREQFAK